MNDIRIRIALFFLRGCSYKAFTNRHHHRLAIEATERLLQCK